MEIINKKLEELIPYEKNPRNNDEAVEYVANSIKEFGFKVPIVVDKDGVIIAGHTRYKASKKLGLKEVPCIVADDLSEEQINAFRLADNKVSEQAKWNKDLLKEELDKLYGFFDMSDFGFSIQIEDIDLDEDGEEKIVGELGEANNYVVLEFDTELDWEDAQQILGIERVQTGEENKKIRRHGLGRVIKGKDVIERLKENENIICDTKL